MSGNTFPAAAPAPAVGTKRGWLVLALLWSTTLISSADRSAMSIVAPFLSKEIGLSPADLGLVLGVVFLSYTLVQIPAGYLGDRFGQRRFVIGALILWSVFSVLTGFVAVSLPLLIVARLMLGLGEGLYPPQSYRILANWYPAGRRAGVTAISLTAVSFGAALVPLIAAPIIQDLGWRWVFYLSGVPAVVVLIGLVLWLRDAPPGATAPEPGQRSRRHVAFDRRFWLSANPWLTFGSSLGLFFALYGLTGWLPTYLVKYRGFALDQVATLSSLPFFAGTVGMLIGGWLGTNALREHRKGLVAVCLLAAAACIGATTSAPNVVVAGILLTAGGFFLYASFGPFWSIPLDSAPPDQVGTYLGFVNMAPQIGGFVGPIVIGYLVTDTSFLPGFVAIVAALIASTACILGTRSKPLHEAAEVIGQPAAEASPS